MSQFKPQFKSCANIKTQAKDMLSGKYTAVTLFILIYYMISLIINNFLSAAASMTTQVITGLIGVENTTVVTILLYLFSIAINVLLGVFQVGIALYFLNIACNGNYYIGNLYYGFQYCLGKALGLSLIVTVISELCMLPYEYLSTQKLLGEAISWGSIIFWYLLGTLVYTLISLGISQVYYLLLDFPDLSVSELLKRSIKIMRGHKKRLFLLELSFVPLLFLAVLSLGIGLLWVLPYMNMATTLFFLDIMKPQE